MEKEKRFRSEILAMVIMAKAQFNENIFEKIAFPVIPEVDTYFVILNRMGTFLIFFMILNQK